MTINSLKGRGSDGDYSVKEMDEKLNVPQSIKRLYESIVKYANGKKEMDSILKYADDGTWNTLVSDYNRLSRKCSEELGISLDKFSDYSKNPLFVLFRKGDKGLKNFDSLIQEYFPDELDAYRFLGMEIHPHFFMDDKLIKKEKK